MKLIKESLSFSSIALTTGTLAQSSLAKTGLVSNGMGDLISGESLSDESLNQGPWHCPSGNSMNFPLGIIQFNFFSKFFIPKLGAKITRSLALGLETQSGVIL